MPDDARLIREALVEACLIGPDERPQIVPLGGGVSCDVYRVELASGPVCVKRALPRLRVTSRWEASPERSHSEVEWLAYAGSIGLPVPRVLAELPDRHLFVMAYLDPQVHPVWKTRLAAGDIDPAFAAKVGAGLARIHDASHDAPDLATRFAKGELFHALRIEPYFLHSARHHPDLAERLHRLADATGAARIALVHGDISPKNILAGPDGPVFIDAECATWGDPAFDPAFCLTHLLLKCIWHPQWAADYLAAYRALAEEYLGGARWEPRDGLTRRIAELIAALLLARVDGKSPAEYLESDADREWVRTAARALLLAPPMDPEALATTWQREIALR